MAELALVGVNLMLSVGYATWSYLASQGAFALPFRILEKV